MNQAFKKQPSQIIMLKAEQHKKLLHRRWWQAIKILKRAKVTERKQVHMLKYRTSTTQNLLKELKTLKDIERKNPIRDCEKHRQNE